MKRKNSTIKYIIKGFDMIICGIVMYALWFVLPKRLWIISERTNQAQDNGIDFFEYINKNNVNIQCYYLLEKDNNNFNKVNEIGKVLIKHSLKHKIFFLKSSVIAFTEKNMIEPWGSNIFYKYFSDIFPKKYKVFLQHGITQSDISFVYGKAVSNIDLFVTASSFENRIVNQVFGYKKDEIADVGFSRYDTLFKLKNQSKNEKLILYMPTWRRELIDLLRVDDDDYINDMREKFLESDYYKNIMEVINNENLNKLLQKNDYRFMLITHYAINKLMDLFKSSSACIEICKSEDIDIKKKISECKIVITDYSSIHFDSAYLDKNIIYYQFDKDRFYNSHSGKSYFNYELQGFGPVVYAQNDLINELDKLVNENVSSCDNFEYKDRINEFFKFKDNKNSERLFNLIVSKISGGKDDIYYN